MIATVFAESSLYFIFSLGFFCSSDVYRHDSGRCHILLSDSFTCNLLPDPTSSITLCLIPNYANSLSKQTSILNHLHLFLAPNSAKKLLENLPHTPLSSSLSTSPVNNLNYPSKPMPLALPPPLLTSSPAFRFSLFARMNGH